MNKKLLKRCYDLLKRADEIMAQTKRRKKHIKKIGGDPWGALQKFPVDSRYHMTVYPCKPFKHGYEKVINKDQLLSFDIQQDLSEEQKNLVRQFTGGVRNLTVLKALLIERCNTRNADDLTWKDILSHVGTYLNQKKAKCEWSKQMSKSDMMTALGIGSLKKFNAYANIVGIKKISRKSHQLRVDQLDQTKREKLEKM